LLPILASRKITIHNLTSDSSGVENSLIAGKPPLPSLQSFRDPFSIIENGTQRNVKSISLDLKNALATLGESRVREELEAVLRNHDAAQFELENKLLVRGRYVVRYHADSESENEKGGDEEETRRVRLQQRPKRKFAIGVVDDEWTPRFAQCKNCRGEFDVTQNEQRECHWHPGRLTFIYTKAIR
jgi:hypothetical protein